MASKRSDWIYQFERPGFHEMVHLRKILSEMAVFVPKREKHALAISSPTLEGTLDEMMSRLSEALQDDYATNIVEQTSEPWKFDYVVSNDGPNESAIEVYTRLFHPTDATKGNSFYGRTVRRISDAIYRLWIDD